MFLSAFYIGVVLAYSAVAHARDVLVVLTPGFTLEQHLPLIHEIENQGHQVHLVGLTCAAPSVSSLGERLREKDLLLGSDYSVVAHGLGATILLANARAIRANEYLLLGPVLGGNDSEATRAYFGKELDATYEMGASTPWRQTTLEQALFGPDSPKGCLSIQVSRTVRDWLLEETLELDLSNLRASVWIGTSLGDEFSPVERLIPASHRIPNRRITRFGLNRFDPKDYSHGELLMDEAPIRAVVNRIGSLN